MIKLLIVDDQALIRDGLKTVFDLEDDIHVIAVACNGVDAIEKVGHVKPDVILMDIRMPKLDGVEATKVIKDTDEGVKILILTTFDDDEYIIEALVNGADGYLLKDIETERLIESVREVYRGDFMLPVPIAQKLAKKLKQSHSKANFRGDTLVSSKALIIEPLTEREEEIGELLIKGLSNKEISASLYITEGTVKNYISVLYKKLDVSNRGKAVVKLENIKSNQ